MYFCNALSAEVSNQMLELYEQNRAPQSNDAEGAVGSGATNGLTAKGPTSNDETATTNSNSQTGPTSSKIETPKSTASKALPESSATNHVGRPVSNHNRGSDYGSSEMRHRAEEEAKHNQHHEWEPPVFKENSQESADMIKSRSGYGEEQESNGGRSEMKESGEFEDKHASRNLDHRDGSSGRPPQEAIKKIDRDKVKAALEKRRKASGQITKKTEFMDDDDLIERELEDGIELASQNEKNKHDRRQSWSKSSERSDHDATQHGRHQDNEHEHHHGTKGLPSYQSDLSNVEEGELSALDDISPGHHSPKLNNRKRKAENSPDRVLEGKQWHNYSNGSHHHNRFGYMDDRNKVSRLGHTERDSKRHIQENHV